MRDEFRPYSSSHSKFQQKIATSVDLDNCQDNYDREQQQVGGLYEQYLQFY